MCRLYYLCYYAKSFLMDVYLWESVYKLDFPSVVAGDGSKQLCCFMPKNWACSLNFSCHISHFWLIWLVLLREVFSCGRIFIRVRIRDRLCYSPKSPLDFNFVKDENNLFMKFTLFTLLEVVDKCLIFIYLMYANRFHKWFLIEKKKG